MNVLTFLNPLRDYVDEVYRVLKPGGFVVWGNKDVAKLATRTCSSTPTGMRVQQ